jgi:6-pyruvoyltetrahydropterin/6-carboxytetrahydropterin synthase
VAVESHGVLRVLSFSYGHRIRGHRGGCAHLHGHNARVEVECRGPLDALGMVVDFGEIRRVLETWIDANWDHRMILEKGDPLAPLLTERGEPIHLLDAPPTAENLARRLYEVATEAGLPVASIRFWETDRSMALYEGA